VAIQLEEIAYDEEGRRTGRIPSSSHFGSYLMEQIIDQRGKANLEKS
jgi:hypothetical protein